jgi:signal peptide peptidase SppA
VNEYDRTMLLAGMKADAAGRFWAIRDDFAPLLRLMSGDLRLSDELLAALEKKITASEGNEPVKGVATIPIHGAITSQPSLLSMLFGFDSEPITDRVGRQLREATSNPDVKAILLDVDSPGGTVDYVPELASDIRSARKSKPVTAVANTMAASAAYWLASQASDVSVVPSGEVGSIGVFKIHDDISQMDANAGIKSTLIKAGKYKAEMLPYFPLSAEALEYQQGQVNEFYGQFVNDVARGRQTKPGVVKADFGQGRMLLAKKAVKAGLADRVESLKAAQSRLGAMSAGQASEQAAQQAEAHDAWFAEHEDLFDESKTETETATKSSSTTRDERNALLATLLP